MCRLDSPGRIALFNKIADHVYERLQEHGEPAQKRRRVGAETSGSPSSQAAPSNAADEAVLLSIAEISVSVPQRKKLEMCFTSNHLYARALGTTAPLQGVSYAWRDIGSSYLTSATSILSGLPLLRLTTSQQNMHSIFPSLTRLRSSTTTSYSPKEPVYLPRRPLRHPWNRSSSLSLQLPLSKALLEEMSRGPPPQCQTPTSLCSTGP